MLQSRTLTPAFRFFAGLAAFSFVSAFIVGFSSGDQPLMDRIVGPVTLGWKGGIGNHLAYSLFVGLFALSAGLAGLLVAFRDADPEAEAQYVHTETVPLTRAPAGDNYVPLVGAFGIVLVVIGLGTRANWLALSGLVLMVLVGGVWTLRAWAERATGDEHTNAELYHRFIDPLRTPVVAILCIGLVVIGFSRLLLAVNKTASVALFGGVAAAFFIVATILALRPAASRVVITVVVILGALALLAAGIVGAVVGQRQFEHKGETGASQGALPAPVQPSSLTVVLPDPGGVTAS